MINSFRHAATGLLAMLCLSPLAVQAHHVWLEQDAQGARLYFGEFAENLREASPGLLDKFVKPRARVVNANGEARDVALSLRPQAFVLAAPAAAGESLLAEETAYPAFEKREGDKVISRSIWTPAARWINDFQPRKPGLTLDVLPTGSAGEFSVHYKGQPLPDAKVEVTAQSGWSREVKADKQGRFSIALPWQGAYALEVKHNDKSGGERDGQKHDVAMYVTTLTFSLAQGLASPPPPPPAAPNK